MKIFNLFLVVLFVVSAALQYNDPDPLLWISLYLAVALICGFAAFNKYNRWATLLVMAGCIYQLSILLPAFTQWVRDGMPSITQSMKASSPYVELVREFLGVVISMAVLIFQYARSRYHILKAPPAR
ncbi:MAG TPA: transmembrane 220 family protein [Saprospiraceae bacterium]|nr:transmembrane 220 family protein [Saprospiraceae bacterium]